MVQALSVICPQQNIVPVREAALPITYEVTSRRRRRRPYLAGDQAKQAFMNW